VNNADATVLAGEHGVEVIISRHVRHDQVVDPVTRDEEVLLHAALVEVVNVLTARPDACILGGDVLKRFRTGDISSKTCTAFLLMPRIVCPCEKNICN
jgi:hypothetical protein